MRRFLLLLLTLGLAAVPATANATTFGAAVGGAFWNQHWGIWSPAQTLSSLDALHSAGGRVGRSDSDWAGAEPNAPVHRHHIFQWSYDDMVVGEMAQAHLRWEPTLEFAPKWAQEHAPHVLHLRSGRFVTPLPPAKNSNFAAYATAFMRRYGSHGSFWASHRTLPYLPVNTLEVWNEPDEKHTWGPHINLADYARMYEVVRGAIHRVNRQARVVTGGLAWTHSSLPRLLKAFEGKPIDAVAIHPYGPTPRTTLSLARYAIGLMREYHRGRTPLIANEYGWTSERDTWGTTKASNVNRYVYAALTGLAKLRIAQILPFQWADPRWGLNNGTFAQAIARITHNRL